MPRLALAAAALVLVQCAAVPPATERFAFAVMGDVPYNAGEEAKFVAMVDALGREALEFVVHVGDFRGDPEPCTDELFERRRAQLDRSAHPLVYTPGDNEWVDCPGARRGSVDPLERLAALRRLFFAGDTTLGRRRFATEAQRECVRGTESACDCPRYVENRAWTLKRVRFVTLHYAGQDNNVGRGESGDAEARCRNEANRRWLERAFADARAPGIAALVVITQANPWFTPNDAFAPFIAQLAEGAAGLRRPVLLVHGDTHMYRVDNPFRDSLGFPLPYFTRLETYGSPFVGWAWVGVDPASAEPFRFDSRLFAFVPP